MTDEKIRANRWRLILGKFSRMELGFSGDESELERLGEMEELLDYLYGRAQGGRVRSADRSGTDDKSVVNAVDWITRVRTLFPKSTCDVLEKQALDEFNMSELVTDKEVLEKLTPDMDLLKAIMQLKDHMSGEVLETAYRVAAKIAGELAEKLEFSVRRALTGRIDKTVSSPVHSYRDIDIKKTIRRNLKNYDRENERLMIQDISFNSRVRRYNDKTVILAVDESGSMLGSVIYSAVMAQIISKLRFADLKLVVFDTSVVDLTYCAQDPAKVLMSVQLGGGTDIGSAAAYCEGLMTAPSQTCFLIVTDLFEGVSTSRLLNVSRSIIESGAKLSFLTALDENSNPAYDRRIGQALCDMGAFVGAVTPDRLGDYIAGIFD